MPDSEPAIDLRAVGDRIETLLEASSSGGIVARERAEELVRLLSGLYGAGLLRMMEILDEQGALSDRVLDALIDDDLVASLLLIHDLHPQDVTTRVERALDSVRPYLGSHGGDVQLVGISDDGVSKVTVAFTVFGDANLDGKVNAIDFNILASNFGLPNGTWDHGDFNYDGAVTAADFTKLSQDFNKSAPIPTAAPVLGSLVPEPGSVGLLITALGLITRRRRQGH